jgi:hypothetical protein
LCSQFYQTKKKSYGLPKPVVAYNTSEVETLTRIWKKIFESVTRSQVKTRKIFFVISPHRF